MKKYFVHESSYIDEDVTIGDCTKIWHFSHIQCGAKIGKNCVLGQNVNISNNVCIGDNCKIQNNVSIYEGVTIQDDVFCGPSMVFTNDINPRAFQPKGRENYKKTLVCKGATIGANSTILCGNRIGRYALIAAGSVVTCDVPDYALMKGIPAIRTGWVCVCGNKLDTEFNCKICGKKYKVTSNRLHEITI